ncbi:hypothetical protein EDD53_0922 [Pacificibacter maritimus]|uniref:Uncharacterized protein n=1 Tax=Pacificibacter maritimus TaxID=762213 RepID=A0A3N4VFS6_9RHOB|nr:hypothetical protein [Pacificibacter maritimus]RPE71794.1 hypothetical protein EDD53_0922 [Pacificibacter maritimus]
MGRVSQLLRHSGLGLSALGLVACMNGDAVQTSAKGFTFQVTVDGDTAVARNYHTGALNFAKLEEAARGSIEAASGCSVQTLVKRDEINTFDATLICAG